MNDRVPLSQSLKQEPQAPEPQGHEGVWKDTMSFLDFADYHKMANFLGVNHEDRRDQKMAEKISFLTDWATEISKSDDIVDHFSTIKQFIKDLGFQQIGKDLLVKLYGFARLDQDKRKMEKEMELYREKPKEEAKAVEQVEKPESIKLKDIKKVVQEELQGVSKQIKSSIGKNVSSQVNKTISEVVGQFIPPSI